MAKLPVDPRVARVLLEGVRLECGAPAVTLAAWLSSVDPRERPPEKAQEADLAHQPFRDGEGDLIGALRLWQAWEEAQRTLGSSALKRWCRERHLSHRRLREWTDVRRQLDRLLRERLEIDPGPDHAIWRAAAVHRGVLSGYASQVALKGRDGLYRLADGSTFSLHPRSGLARSQPPWVVALEVVDTGRRQARVVARIQPTWVERAAPHLMKRTLSEPHWVRETGQVAAWERVSMGQLDLVERRRVPFGPVNPIEARVVFIRGALVEEQLGIAADFLDHNRRVRDDAEAWAQARRRSDLLADAEAAYAFYDARVPATVHSRPDFERWRKQAEIRNPGLLRMERSDLVTDVADDEAFPRRLVTPAGDFAVAYRHAPGEAEDGLTLTVPLVSLGDLDAGQLEWSVPGRRVEMVQALIRSLPKRVRVRFQPVEEFCEGFLQAHQPSDGAMRSLLARHLAAASGLEISAADFDMKAVPEHLLPRVRIVDGERVRAEGRDAERLRQELSGDLAAARSALMRGFEQGRWCGVRHEAWPTFAASLPVRLEVPHSMGVMHAWGTLAARPEGVETAWAATQREAGELFESAMLRWMHARLRSQVQHHLDFDPAFQPLQWSSRGLGSPAGLVHVAAMRSVQIACVGEEPWPRTDRELEACIDRGGASLLAASQSVLRVLEAASRVAERLRNELSRPAPADWSDLVDRTRAEVDWLLGAECLERASPRLFHRLPDLLQACVDRVQRLGGGGAVAVRHALEALAPWQERARTQTPAGQAGRQFREMVVEAGLGLHARGGGPWPRVRDLERTWAVLVGPEAGRSASS
jgi:ATP-dependent helicase HrpA